MNKKHLIWIIPVCLIFGFIVGAVLSLIGQIIILERYPVIGCIHHMDDALNAGENKLPFTAESQREAIQWRCAKEYVDFNVTDYKEIFEAGYITE